MTYLDDLKKRLLADEITTEELREKLAPKYPVESLAGWWERANNQERELLREWIVFSINAGYKPRTLSGKKEV